MTLYHPDRERPEDAAMRALLPKGESRRLADDELSKLVWDMAPLVWVWPQNRRFQEDAVGNVALELLTRRAEEPSILSTFDEIIPWVKRSVEADIAKQRRVLEARPDQADATVTDRQAPRDDINPAAKVDVEELAGVAQRAVDLMPLARRQVVQLIRGEGLNRVQAAQVLHKAEKTVRNHLTLGLKDLRRAVEVYLESGIVEEPKP